MRFASSTSLVLIMSGVFGTQGCRMSKLGKDYPDASSETVGGDAAAAKGPILQPQRQAETDVTLNVTLDANGKVTETLTLKLDYFPAPRPDGVSVPTCYNEIAGHFLVGRLVCGSSKDLSTDVLVSQVGQQCYTSTPMRKIAPKAAITLPGCVGPAELQTFRYEPRVKLEVTK